MPEVKKVLIVDDSILARNLLCNAILEKQEGWELVQATSGEDAIDKLKDQDFDHYIIDYNMPGMNGLELAEFIRNKNSEAHIALCTANIQSAIKTKAEDIGLFFINKPVSEEGISAFFAKAF